MKKILMAVATLAVMAFAEPNTHDGFYLNFTLGLGYQNFGYEYTTSEYKGMTLDASGVSLDADTKIGGRIAPNLILHATITEIQNFASLEMKDDGRKIGESDQTESLLLFGAGLTYYLANNMFLTGSLGIASFTITSADNSSAGGSSSAGFGFQVGFGKEWWVSSEWGMGVMGALTYGSADDQDDIGEMSAFAIGVKFTMTYN